MGRGSLPRRPRRGFPHAAPARMFASGIALHFCRLFPSTPAVEGKPATETWQKVYFNNENFNPSGFYTESQLTPLKILELKGETSDVRSTDSISVNFKGYLYGDKHYEGNDDYNDWIVRISPATKKNVSTDPDPDPEVNTIRTTRVYVEDLYCEANGGKSDWDFNDVVFDVVYNLDDNGVNVLTTDIIIQAAGGTLPLYLTAGGERVEVHEAFGQATTTMINTNNGTLSLLPASPAEFHFSGKILAADVKVEVQHSSDVPLLEIKAVKGDPAAKFAVSIPQGQEASYRWPNEQSHISTTFPGFKTWVNEGGSLDNPTE